MTDLIPTSSIKADPRLQARAVHLDENHVDSLVRAIGVNPGLLDDHPIQLADVDNELLIVDGFHRHAAATKQGLPAIPAVIVAKNWHEALKHAVTSNDHEGSAMKRTTADRRRALELLLADAKYRELSNAQLAAMVGVTAPTVGNLRNTNPQFQSDTRKTATGKTISAAATSGSANRPTKPEPTVDDRAALMERIRELEQSLAEATADTLALSPYDEPAAIAKALIQYYGKAKCRDIVTALADLAAEVEQALIVAMAAQVTEYDELDTAERIVADKWIKRLVDNKPFRERKTWTAISTNMRGEVSDEIAAAVKGKVKAAMAARG